MVTVLTVETPTLGDRSYLVHDGDVAVVVDPQRDYDRVLALVDATGVRVTHVLETHVHNDYVTGGLALARQIGAKYVMNADDDVAFARTGVRDGDAVETGGLRLRAMLTPGHTHTHLSYVLETGGEPVAVFTGGSLLYGSTGRPDLLGDDQTDGLARAQWRSAHRLADELPETTAVYPTHGFGSFCSSSQATGIASTLGQERRTNLALTADESRYVEALLAGLDAYPAYYAHMAGLNAQGPRPADLSPPHRADAVELRRRLTAGEWVVDLRTRTAFAAGHVRGTVNIGLDGQFVTYLGWLLPWGTPVTLLAESADEVASAQREMVRIGIDRPAAAATGGPGEWADGEPASFPTATFSDLAAAMGSDDGPVVLDVRRDDERQQSHVRGSVHVPIHEVLGRLADVPDGQVWVHCGSGYRAAVVAAVLDAHGRDVVLIDDAFPAAGDAGVPLAQGA